MTSRERIRQTTTTSCWMIHGFTLPPSTGRHAMPWHRDPIRVRHHPRPPNPVQRGSRPGGSRRRAYRRGRALGGKRRRHSGAHRRTLNAAFGWWWADPVAALGMTFFLVREGLESWRGEE